MRFTSCCLRRCALITSLANKTFPSSLLILIFTTAIRGVTSLSSGDRLWAFVSLWTNSSPWMSATWLTSEASFALVIYCVDRSLCNIGAVVVLCAVGTFRLCFENIGSILMVGTSRAGKWFSIEA